MKMGKKLRTLGIVYFVLILALLSFTVACAQPAQAPTPTPTSKSTPASAPVSFEGKTITLILGGSVGGGTDLFSRVYVRYLNKYLPGNPTMVVRNILGAAGQNGMNTFYRDAKPDGLIIGVAGTSPHIAYLVGASAVKYDLLKTIPIIAVSNGGMYYIKPGMIARPEDILKAKGLIFGSGTGFAPLTWLFIAGNELLNIPFEKVTTGYSGTTESRRAYLSGEINFHAETSAKYLEQLAPYVERGEIMPLWQSGILDKEGKLVKDPVMPPTIPTFAEFYEKLYGKSPSGMPWEAYKSLLAAYAFNYDLHLPPGTPENIVRTYWDAAEKMLKDPDFRRDISLLISKDAAWMVGESLGQGFKQFFRMEPKVAEWLRDIAKTKYRMVVD